MKKIFSSGKITNNRFFPRPLGSEMGVAMILVCLAFLAIIGVIAISIDGFSLVHSKLTLHNSAEYAAESGLRYFKKQLAGCALLTEECECDVDCVDIGHIDCFACIEEKACLRAQVVAQFRLFAGGLNEEINFGCGSGDPGPDGWFQLGYLTGGEPGTFIQATNKDEVVAARAFLEGTQDKLFFAQIWGYTHFNLGICAVSKYDPPPDDWLYEYRFIQSVDCAGP